MRFPWLSRPLLGISLLALLFSPFVVTAEDIDRGAAIKKAIDRSRIKIETEQQASGTPGVQVAVMVGGEIAWSEGFGWANRDTRMPATPTTRFGIGSISKTLTLVTCARLVDRGRLDWDTPVESYLQDFPHADRGITVRNIGAHLSGMGDDFAKSVYGTMRPYTTTEAYREVVKAPLVHEPGEAHLYATGTFTVIAAVLETLEGIPFPEVVAHETTGPLGLHNTLPQNPHENIPSRTSFYVSTEDSLETVESNPSHTLAGGGYLSTATDLVQLGHSVVIGEFVSPESRAELLEDQKTKDGAWTFFGLGWRMGRSSDWGFFYGQSGGGPGIAASLLVIPDHDLVVAVCTNLTDAPAWEMTKGTATLFVEALGQ